MTSSTRLTNAQGPTIDIDMADGSAGTLMVLPTLYSIGTGKIRGKTLRVVWAAFATQPDPRLAGLLSTKSPGRLAKAARELVKAGYLDETGLTGKAAPGASFFPS